MRLATMVVTDMTDRDSKHDEELSALYRKVSQQHSPAALDQRVLKMARTAVKPTTRSGWLLPISLAASITLAVGVAYKVTDSAQLMAPEAPAAAVTQDALNAVPVQADEQTSATPDSSFAADSDDQALEFEVDAQAAQETIENRVRRAAPVPAPGATLSEAPEEINHAAEARAKQAREARVDQNNQQFGRTDDEPVLMEANDLAGLSAPGNAALRLEKSAAGMTWPCADHVDDADEWARCIVNLRQTGEKEVAEAELLLWEAAFPDTSFPEF